MSDADFPYLSVLTALPLVGALVVALLRRRPDLARQVALAWSLLVLGLTVAMWLAFDAHGARFQLRESYPWIATWDVRFSFAVERIALVMIGLVAVLVPLVILYSWSGPEGEAGAPARRSVPAFFALVLALQSTMIGVFAAADIFLF